MLWLIWEYDQYAHILISFHGRFCEFSIIVIILFFHILAQISFILSFYTCISHRGGIGIDIFYFRCKILTSLVSYARKIRSFIKQSYTTSMNNDLMFVFTFLWKSLYLHTTVILPPWKASLTTTYWWRKSDFLKYVP